MIERFIKCHIMIIRYRTSAFTSKQFRITVLGLDYECESYLSEFFSPVGQKCPLQRVFFTNFHYRFASCNQKLHSMFVCQIKQHGHNGMRTFFNVVDDKIFSDHDLLTTERRSLFQIEN
jgi:hypothetical protein